MTYLPKHQAQLDGSYTQRRDCGPRSVSVGIDALTQGHRVPSIPEIRARMHTLGNTTTNVYDAQRGVESYDSLPGRRPLHYRVLRDAEDVKNAVRAGRPVQLAIDYGNFNRSGRTGDPNFMGGHSVLVKGQRTHKGEVQWRLYDSLDDRRRAGIPQGWRWVSRERLMDALRAFSPGNVFAGSFIGGQRRG